MKKSLVLASLLALVATSAVASEVKNGAFVGVEIGSTSYDMKVDLTVATVGSGSATESDSGGSQSLKAGYYLGEAGRVYGALGRVNMDGGTILNYGVGYDYLWYNSSDFIPFVGATVGYQKIDIDNSSLDLSGITYGAELGVQYAINKNFDLELGYRMNFSSTDDSESGFVSGNAATAKYTIENTKIWYIGFNYNF